MGCMNVLFYDPKAVPDGPLPRTLCAKSIAACFKLFILYSLYSRYPPPPPPPRGNWPGRRPPRGEKRTDCGSPTNTLIYHFGGQASMQGFILYTSGS